METKENLSPSGCFARALPGEPMFTLLARDEHAPETMRKWADLRARRWLETKNPEDEESAAQALADAVAFEAWRTEHYVEWRGAEPSLPEAPSEDMTSLAGRILAHDGRPNAQLLKNAKSLAGALLRLDSKAGQGAE